MGSETMSFNWEGSHAAQVNGVTAEQVWSVISDFCNVHKWFPTINTCQHVEGNDGEPGVIRYCASTKTNEEETVWAKERLVMINHIERCLSYEIVDNNAGFRSYVATVKVMGIDGLDEAFASKGCSIDWSFVCDPVDGWKKEDLDAYVDFCLQHLVNKIENNFLNT